MANLGLTSSKELNPASARRPSQKGQPLPLTLFIIRSYQVPPQSGHFHSTRDEEAGRTLLGSTKEIH